MKLTRAEFERLALDQLDMVWRMARRLTRDISRAEDLVQETYLRALRGQAGFNLEEFGIRPWLLRILHNLHYSNALRDSRQPRTVDGEQLELTKMAARPSDVSMRSSGFDGMDGRIARAIESLPEEYQSVLMLWAVEDFSYKEIADALDVPIGTVMSRLHRARQRLTEKLRDYAVETRIIRE